MRIPLLGRLPVSRDPGTGSGARLACPGVGEQAPGTWACLGSVVAERGLSGTYKWTMSERTPDPLSPPISSKSPWLPGCLFFFFLPSQGGGKESLRGGMRL